MSKLTEAMDRLMEMYAADKEHGVCKYDWCNASETMCEDLWLVAKDRLAEYEEELAYDAKRVVLGKCFMCEKHGKDVRHRCFKRERRAEDSTYSVPMGKVVWDEVACDDHREWLHKVCPEGASASFCADGIARREKDDDE